MPRSSLSRLSRVVVGALCSWLLGGAAQAQSDACGAAGAVPAGNYSGTTAGSTNDGSADCGLSATSPDRWYRFAAPGAGVLRVNTCGSSYDTVLSIHTACPALGTQLACNDDTGGTCGQGSTVQVVVTAGTEYWIRVSGFSNATGSYALSITFNPPSPDDCGSARVIGDGTFAGTTLGAANDGTADCGASATSPDVWFAYVATENCSVHVDTCGSTFDTVVSVLTACPGSGVQLGCNDDTGGACGLGSTVNFTASTDATYLIRVAGYNGAVGDFTLHTQRLCAPLGADACSDAIPISVGTSFYSTQGATNDAALACGGSATTPDVWFRYTADENSDVIASTCGSAFDTVVSVHSGCPATDANLIICNDDSCGTGSSATFAATNGTSYLIRVSGHDGAVGSFTLQVRVVQPGATGADVYVGEIGAMVQLGREGGTVGCAIDSPLCNSGSVPLETVRFPDVRHPFFIFNMYRLRDDRLEQIGQSWAKHMQGSAQGNACGFGCDAYPDGSHLGVGCSDIYSAGFNGTQAIMTSRREINPYTGTFDPLTSLLNNPGAGPQGPVARRLQLRDADLDPVLNQDSAYFAEQYTLAHDDADHSNSVAREQVLLSGAPGGTWNFGLSATASINGPAIDSWSGSTRTTIRTPAGASPTDGACILRAKVTDNGNGTWHYEYALYNHDLDRGVRSFAVPVGATTSVTNISFHAPLSHDEPFHNGAWTAERRGQMLVWETDAYTPALVSNPLRWGTLYNFRFDAAAPQVASRATLGVYKPGTPDELTGDVPAPATACAADFNNDGNRDPDDLSDFITCFFLDVQFPGTCAEADFNGDGFRDPDDLADFVTTFFLGC